MYLKKPGKLEVTNRTGYDKYKESLLSLDEKLTITKTIDPDLIKYEELKILYEKKKQPIAYDGFEPSGRMHIAQGVLKAINANKLTSCGCIFVFWIADWFALLNNKMGGDLKKIQNVGKYFIHIWKAMGMDLTNVRFLWASEEIERDSTNYWLSVMNIAKSNTISRIKRCSQIMGRIEGDEQSSAQILYSCMQAADIFYIGADICQLGVDQRKVNMLAREYVDQYNKINKDKLHKPIIISHQMLPGLIEGEEKMSKSNPESAIFVEDSPQEINKKIKRAFCPANIIEGNPIVAYTKMLVFPKYGEILIERSAENGGNSLYNDIETFEKDYKNGLIHPSDLKAALSKSINNMLEPVREYFKTNIEAKNLLEIIKKYQVTK